MYELEGVGHAPRRPLVGVTVSYHKEQQYIYGLGVGFWMVSDILSLIWTGGGEVYSQRTPVGVIGSVLSFIWEQNSYDFNPLYTE